VPETDQLGDTEFFFRLSPERVLQAVEAGGFRPTGHCFALNALENRVYDVRLDDDRHVVAKFYRPLRWTRDAILDEHRMLFALREAEIPVCAPVRFDDGESVHEVEGIHYAVWPRTGGRSPDEISDSQVRVLGRLLARIHSVGEAQHLEHRRALSSDTVVHEALDVLEAGDFLPPHCVRRYRDTALEIAAVYDQLSRGVPTHPIHGDCHVGNLLRGDEGWFFLDFDDMTTGPAVHDVWMLLPGRDAHALRQRELLVEAYREFRPFEASWLELVEPLRAFRFIFYAGWIAKRWRDPAFPDAFPHFGTDDYWENETRDLEQQLERISLGDSAGVDGAGEASAQQEEHEGELTNKDFFWDL
jgi:Ser/Thr protein kinase RdoA (MazF antagonist)